ncbi:MAG: transporter substrate-binding domain-containing protein [Myxococcota bacterium]
MQTDTQHKKLVVAVPGDYAPFQSLDANGQMVGLDVDVLKDLGRRMDRTIEIVVPDRFEDSFEMLRRGEVDVVAASHQHNQQRQEDYGLLSTPAYYRSYPDVFWSQKSGSFNGDQFLKSNATVAVERGTAMVDVLKTAGVSASRIKLYDTNQAAVQAVLSGDADSVITKRPALVEIPGALDRLEVRSQDVYESIAGRPNPGPAISVRADRPALFAELLSSFMGQHSAGLHAALASRYGVLPNEYYVVPLGDGVRSSLFV